MMKKKTIVTFLLLSLTLMMMLPFGISAQAAGKKTKACKAYRKFLEKSNSDVMWGTAYLNNDTIPDLVTYTAFAPIGKPMVYTYRKNKVVKVSLSMANSYYSHYYKKKGVVLNVPVYKKDWPYDFKEYCTFNFKKTATARNNNVKAVCYQEDKKYYKPDQKSETGWTQIKKAEFSKLLKKKVGNAKPKKIKYYKNTAENRKKHLK